MLLVACCVVIGITLNRYANKKYYRNTKWQGNGVHPIKDPSPLLVVEQFSTHKLYAERERDRDPIRIRNQKTIGSSLNMSPATC
jgi:hypothetical protein